MLKVRHNPGHLKVGTDESAVTAMTTTGWGATWVRRYGDGGDLHVSIPLTNRGLYLSAFSPRIGWQDTVEKSDL